MSKVTQTMRLRQRRVKTARSRLGTIGLGCGLLVGLLIAVAIFAATLGFASLTRGLPSPAALPALLEPPQGTLLEPTRFYDRSGQHVVASIEPPGAGERRYLTMDGEPANRLPPALVSTTIAASDPHFWTHPGYSLNGLRDGDHPTLAQRLAADLLLWDESPGLRRSLRERFLAAQLTTLYGREKILEWYINSTNYGNLAYGADTAAQIYFGKPAIELSLAEAAVLAAVSEAPALNPWDTPDEAVFRQRELLKEMLEGGTLKTIPFREAMAEELAFKPKPEPERDPMATFSNLVREQLAEKIDRERLERGGFRITTTLDYDFQMQADCVIQAQLNRVAAGSEGESSSGATGECQAERLLPRLKESDQEPRRGLGASAVILDSDTGQILALVGDPERGMDPARPPGRPPGTLLTPFIHLAAYTRGLSPGSLSWDIPANLPPSLQGIFEPSDAQFRGPMRLRVALANDYLLPSIQLLDQIGPENVARILSQVGIDTVDIPPGDQSYRLPLDLGRATLLELTHAYSIFSNLGVLAGEAGQGVDILPSTVLKVNGVDGTVWMDDRESESRPVVSSQLAYLITNILSDETARWETMGHPNPLEIGRPAGSKIGVTSQSSDIWTIGFTPEQVVGVWVGERVRDIGHESSGDLPPELASGLWHAIIQYASRDLPPEDWEQPPGLAVVEVCDPSGMLPTAECPKVVREIFLQGNEPTQPDTLFQKFQINRETGRLATVFTPPELVEERVFLVVPPEASSWAADTGLSVPPDDYDLIFAPQQTSPDAHIDRPEMFTYVHGKQTILGSAKGEGFNSYRLRYGQGLNPQSWIQLGEDSRDPVEDGRLGTWDTTGLSGLYALQLLVVYQDQRVESATIQVTVDNTPPEVQIISPGPGRQYNYSEEQVITLQVKANDDLALGGVRFYGDGNLLATIREEPFALPRSYLPGEYTLRVEAFDRAGNISDATVKFSVIR